MDCRSRLRGQNSRGKSRRSRSRLTCLPLQTIQLVLRGDYPRYRIVYTIIYALIPIAGDSIEITKPLVDMRCKEMGGSISMEVITTTTTRSDTTVVTQWMHDGEPIVFGTKYDCVGSTPQRHVLHIRDICARDAGDYTFVVAGRNTTARLAIEHTPQFVNTGNSIYKVSVRYLNVYRTYRKIPGKYSK